MTTPRTVSLSTRSSHASWPQSFRQRNSAARTSRRIDVDSCRSGCVHQPCLPSRATSKNRQDPHTCFANADPPVPLPDTRNTAQGGKMQASTHGQRLAILVQPQVPYQALHPIVATPIASVEAIADLIFH